VVQAHAPADHALAHRQTLAVAQAHAAVAAVQLHHATGSGGRVLRCQRDGQAVVKVALASVHAGREFAGGVQPVVQRQAQLALGHVLARLVQGGIGHRLTWVGFELRARQAQRIARDRLVEHVGNQGHAGLPAGVPAQFGIGVLAPGRAIDAPAVGGEIAVVDQVVEQAVLPRRLHAVAAQAIAAGVQTQANLGPRGTVGGEHLHHTTGRIAVQLGQRAAQHLDALR